MIVKNIVSHKPFKAGNEKAYIEIEGQGRKWNNARLRFKATATGAIAKYEEQNEDHVISMIEVRAHGGTDGGLDELRTLFKTVIAPQLPSDVTRTARRILQVAAWIVDLDPLRKSKIKVDVIGPYNPVRPDRNHLFVVRDSNVTLSRATPVIVSLDEDLLPSASEIENRLNKVVEKRECRAHSAQWEVHYQDDPDRQIRAKNISYCRTLEEAQRILRGDPSVPESNASGGDETDATEESRREQVSLTRF